MSKVILISVLLLLTAMCQGNQNYTPNGATVDQCYYLDTLYKDAVNEIKADYNLLRSAMLYRFCHYIANEDDVEIGAYTQEISLSEADDIRAITAEMCVNGVMKYLDNTAEVDAWKSATTLAAGLARIYLFSWDGSSATVGSSITVTAGTAVSSLEVAVYPACPSGEVPFGALWIENDTAAFTPGTTDFAALASTLETIFSPMPGGASAPTATGFTDVTFVDIIPPIIPNDLD